MLASEHGLIRSFQNGAMLGMVAGLLLAAASAQAQEKVRRLAMISPEATKIKTTTAGLLAAEPVQTASLSGRQTAVAATTPAKHDSTAQLSATALSNSPVNSDQSSPLVLVREQYHSNRSVEVAAGYGRLWTDQSMLHIISPARQEPGCAYLKASINF